eukprot:CAMPEP_0185027536 /NCGR_PEP_ID=MMETSP1103-20130426/12710_1 /TAXON_ID=36769 /ORGANISM="Paraphysomonas bandaiensis, Strain Caron Lab Isolate" /LENGTH=199 /DNA_ID=CAMNT_0027561591 /DNA_START=149 /DNA_END=748 /DNA_ORIENTATION=-
MEVDATPKSLWDTAKDKVLKLVRMDEKSVKKREMERNQKKAINEVFRGTGLVGGVFGGVMKAALSMASNVMEETRADIEDVQKAVERALLDDYRARDALGYMLTIHQPHGQSMMGLNVNGQQRKRVGLEMRVTGDKGNGIVKAVADVDTNNITIKELEVIADSSRRPIVIAGESSFSSSGRENPTIVIDATATSSSKNE